MEDFYGNEVEVLRKGNRLAWNRSNKMTEVLSISQRDITLENTATGAIFKATGFCNKNLGNGKWEINQEQNVI